MTALLVIWGWLLIGAAIGPSYTRSWLMAEQARYLIGEHWLDGELNATWTSEQPGVTGPLDFEATHSHQAQSPPPDITNGWRYFWSQPAGTDG